MAKVTLGTGSSILMDVGPQRCAAGNGIVSTICWSLPDTLHYALEGIIVSTGATIAWLRDQVGLISVERGFRGHGERGGQQRWRVRDPRLQRAGLAALEDGPEGLDCRLDIRQR